MSNVKKIRTIYLLLYYSIRVFCLEESFTSQSSSDPMNANGCLFAMFWLLPNMTRKPSDQSQHQTVYSNKGLKAYGSLSHPSIHRTVVHMTSHMWLRYAQTDTEVLEGAVSKLHMRRILHSCTQNAIVVRKMQYWLLCKMCAPPPPPSP